MKLSTNFNINFNAQCRGQYLELKNIALENGLPKEKADIFEERIQKIFPDENQILKFYYLGTKTTPTRAGIHLIKNDKVLSSIESPILPKNIKNYKLDEIKQAKSEIFNKIITLIIKLKKKYEAKLAEDKINEEKEKIAEEIKNKSLNRVSLDRHCIISNTLNIIKNTSINAGLDREKADIIDKKIRKIFSSQEFNLQTLHLLLDEEYEKNGNRRYIIYHTVKDIGYPYPIIMQNEQKDYLSKSCTKEDRKNLLPTLYLVIKKRYKTNT